MMVGMFASGFTRDVNELLACRIVVGIGIGTVLAGMAAITAEYAPARHRSFAVGFLQSPEYPGEVYAVGAAAYGPGGPTLHWSRSGNPGAPRHVGSKTNPDFLEPTPGKCMLEPRLKARNLARRGGSETGRPGWEPTQSPGAQSPARAPESGS